MAADKTQTNDDAQGFIDAHVHVWTPDTKKYPRHKAFEKTTLNPKSFTPEQLLSQTKPVGVSRIVLIQMSVYRSDNAYMLEAMRRYPQVFSGVAIVDGRTDPSDAMRRLKKLGVRGFRIRGDNRPLAGWLDGEAMKAMWQCGAKDQLAICHLIGPDALPSVDRMCAKHPDTPVVIDHFARIGIDGTIRENDLKSLCRLARHKNVSVKISAFYALGKKKSPYDDLLPMIRRLVDAFGPRRLMWATDSPFQVVAPHTYKQSLELIRDQTGFLSGDDRQWLLSGTAERVFFS